jgi:glycosyltransferase involved in cell wall biosynthesis
MNQKKNLRKFLKIFGIRSGTNTGQNSMKKLKIAQVVSLSESVPPTSQNGLEFVVSWLTEELVARGHDVTLFAPGDSKTSAKLVSLLPKAVARNRTRPWEDYFFSIWNSIISSSGTFDIIHSHNSNGSYTAAQTKTPVIETIHSAFNSDLKDLYLDDSTNTEALKPILDQYAKVNYVCVSKKQESEHMPVAPFYFKKHSVIHNGIPVEQFEFNATPKDYFLYIGYINKNKGADVAVRVAHKLGLKLVLAGSNLGEEAFFEEHIKPFLSEKITYVGPVDFKRKNELYKNAIAKLAPLAWHEPFGLTLIEAQACGTPVIAFDMGAASEIVSHGKTGFVVKTEQQMIDAIGKIGSIDRATCRTWVENNFSVKKMVDEYEKLYERLSNNT